MKPGAGLWLVVGAGFLLLACAWSAMFFYAGRAQVESVPLVGSPAASTTGTK